MGSIDVVDTDVVVVVVVVQLTGRPVEVNKGECWLLVEDRIGSSRMLKVMEVLSWVPFLSVSEEGMI